MTQSIKKLSTALFVSAGIAALAACGGSQTEEGPEEAPAETEAPAEAPEPEAEAPAEEEVAAVPEVEANGTVIEVQMLNADPDDPTKRMVFKPHILKAKVGDTVKFVPTDPAHQSSSLPDMVPAGVTGWEGQINKEVSYTFPKPGIYGYKCVPHVSAGMVGVVIVEGEGMTDNLEAAKTAAGSLTGLGKKTFEDIWAEIEADGTI
ncbi:MAG: plastocyanin/azurin family copper-binding protein [Pseudomonadota bacterium]